MTALGEVLTPDEARRIRIALIFGDPAVDGLADPGLESAKQKLWRIERGDQAIVEEKLRGDKA